MPIMVDRKKWILYKHTNDYEMIKAVALVVKNECASNVSDTERRRMQERLAALDMYKARNPDHKPFDAINHRINTLQFFMFGYEEGERENKRFMFSPLGNLFLQNINDDEKLTKIFFTMLMGLQFQHYGSGTPRDFQLYPFRLIFKLLTDERLNARLYNDEYALVLPFVKEVTANSYDDIVNAILSVRALNKADKIEMLKADEHTYVNCVYEWQYYVQKILAEAGILNRCEGSELCRLMHPSKTNSSSKPTSRRLNDGFVCLNDALLPFVTSMLEEYPYYEKPLRLDDEERMQMDVVKEIYSFYPRLLLREIGVDVDKEYVKMLELPELIEKYSMNPENSTSYLFEDVLTEGFNMFYNIQARKIGGPGETDIECLYLSEGKKFAVDAKSTSNKLSEINAGRMRAHRNRIGGAYTIVVTPRYVPAARNDIIGQPIVIILASTFSEYLYNHLYSGIRKIDYEDFDSIIINNLGTDVSQLISNKTMEKFACRA